MPLVRILTFKPRTADCRDGDFGGGFAERDLEIDFKRGSAAVFGGGITSSSGIGDPNWSCNSLSTSAAVWGACSAAVVVACLCKFGKTEAMREVRCDGDGV